MCTYAAIKSCECRWFHSNVMHGAGATYIGLLHYWQQPQMGDPGLNLAARHPAGIGLKDDLPMHVHHFATITLVSISHSLKLHQIGESSPAHS